MKKLLSLLSVLTISGTAMPNVIAASLYQKEETNLENLSRVKRGIDDGNEFTGGDRIYGSFKPNLWEEIIKIRYNSLDKLLIFQENLKKKLKEYKFNDFSEWIITVTDHFLNNFAKGLWNNWNKIISDWRNSTKKERIRIVINWDGSFYSVNIRTDDTNYYENNYLNRQILNEILLNRNLDNLSNKNWKTILDAIKAKNSNVDISHLSVSNITDKSAKITVNKNGKYDTNSLVNVYFKPDLIIDFKWCLDPINDNNDETILKALKERNPDLDTDQVYVKQKVINGRLDIGVKSNSNKYNTNSSAGCNNFKVKSNLNDIITKSNLNFIDNNSNEALLNELNYLNHDLDVSQLEIVNKTNTSATIKAKTNSNKYTGEKEINYVINQQKNVNLNELIKKAIFFKFRDDNPDLIFKEVKDINTDNLQYSNIELTQTSKPIITSDFDSVCFGRTELKNNSSKSLTLKTQSCSYTIETEKRIRLAKGFGKTEAQEQAKATSSGTIKSSEISDVFEKSDIEQSSMSHGWNLELNYNTQVEATAGFNAGIFSGSASVKNSFGVSASGHGEYGSSNTKSSSHATSSSKGKTTTSEKSTVKTTSLTNNINLENSDEKVISKKTEIHLPIQEIPLDPKTKIVVTATIEQINFKTIFDLKQDIYGNISFNVNTNENEMKNFTFSIGELMKKLSQYNLLPQEIGVYDDGETVYFDGKLNFLIKKGNNAIIDVGEEEPLD